MQNKLFLERSEEFLKEFHLKKDDYKQAREKLYQEGIRLWKILNEKKELKTY